MSERTALVTGATGGLGRHLVRSLLLNGYRVKATGRNRVIGEKLARRCTFIGGDLNEPGLARRLMNDADVVFHCAALSSPWGRTEEFVAANVAATRLLLEAAEAAGQTRFVHVSTPSLTFDFRDQLAIREDAPLPARFANAYAQSKSEAERLVAAAAERGLSAVIIRPRGLIGEFDGALAPRLLHAGRRGVVPIFNGGAALVDLTYLGNVADALVLCDRPDAPRGIFNITNGEPIRVRDLLERFFRALGRTVRLLPLPYAPLAVLARSWEAVARGLDLPEPPLLPYSLGLLRFTQTLDIAKARRELRYDPRISIDEGIARFAHWQAQGSPPWFEERL